MRANRVEQVNVETTPYYHCIARCVRRAFLCGDDPYSGENFDHRKEWVRSRLERLTSLFAIDVLAYAVMSNHVHVVLHVDPERAASWSTEEVVARYCGLFRMARGKLAQARGDGERNALIEVWRARLCDLSWMMRALSEHIARRANREDGVKGRFWEGRFKSQALLDETGLLTCMAYVDLNPVRAGIATTLEGSDFTSVQQRLLDVAKKRARRRKLTAPASLSPFAGQTPSGAQRVPIPMDFAAYLELLDWAGRAVRDDKRGHVSGAEPPLLRALRLSPGGFVAALRHREMATARVLGTLASLEQYAARHDRQRVRGKALAQRMCA